jgi:hypothetical protein
LKYLGEVKARVRLVCAGTILLVLVLVAGASAKTHAHRRHIEVHPPTKRASIYLGERDGYELVATFEEPDNAVLFVDTLDRETQVYTSTAYGAHFHGSLTGGTVSARFGTIGSVAVRFRPEGKPKFGSRGKGCEGPRPRDEEGSFVGHISLRGEGGYFHVAARKVEGYVARTFRVRCRVKRQHHPYPPPSLVEAVAPRIGFSFGSSGGSLALLEAGSSGGGRQVFLRAAHMSGAQPGAEVEAAAFEFQGSMPVGRSASVPQSPAGTLITSLPGEHPATAMLNPAAPFSGKAEYLTSSPTSHLWSGDLAVQFPGLLQPLTGPSFYSSLCVSSPLRDRYGCDFQAPDWQPAE